MEGIHTDHPAMHQPRFLKFLAMLECRDDATRRVAALESLNHNVFEATDTNETAKIFRKVISMLSALLGMSSELQVDCSRS